MNHHWIISNRFALEKGLQSICLALSLLYAPVVKTQLEKVEFENRQRTKERRISYGRGSCDVAGLGVDLLMLPPVRSPITLNYGTTGAQVCCHPYHQWLSLLFFLPPLSLLIPFIPQWIQMRSLVFSCLARFLLWIFYERLALQRVERGVTSWDTLAEWEARRKYINLINYMCTKLYLYGSPLL